MRLPSILFALAWGALSLTAEETLLGPWIGMMQENDLVVRTDRHYTQGLKFTFMSGEAAAGTDHWFTRWADCLPRMGATLGTARYGLSFGQDIFTPTDISTPALQPLDRPYAGYLFASLMLQRRGVTAANRPVLDHWQMELGVIGPEALGEDAQNTVHRLRNFGLAMGWANQLKTEPTLTVKMQRTWLFAAGGADGFEAQFLPHTGASLGNVHTYAAMGGQFRAGWRLPRDFGLQTIDSIVPGSGGVPSTGSHCLGAYVFTGTEGRLLAYNAFLDGTLFRENHHVAGHPFVADLKVGVVLVFKYAELSYTQVFRTKEFTTQKEVDAFGSLALTVKW